MMPASNRKSALRRGLESTLFVLGVAGISIWAWNVLSEGAYEDWQNWVLDQHAAGRSVNLVDYIKTKLRPAEKSATAIGARQDAPHGNTNQGNKTATNKKLVGRISIARLNVRAVVGEGTSEKTLSLALGHIPGTALPGQNGNVGIAGHRDALFRGLKDVQKNDRIIFETGDGDTYTYRVDQIQIVMPSEVSVLNAGLYPELTLVTCYPFDYIGSAPKRFIVKARQISQSTAEAPTPEVTTNRPRAEAEDSRNAEPARAGRKLVRASRELPTPRPPYEAPSSTGSRPDVRRVMFDVGVNRVQQLAPGIWVGLDSADASRSTVEGWVRIEPGRTIRMREYDVQQPVFFIGDDGKERELVILSVSANSMRGYLLVPSA
jgi:LPXTG-site transpeptidase (sortase) family protein